MGEICSTHGTKILVGKSERRRQRHRSLQFGNFLVELICLTRGTARKFLCAAAEYKNCVANGYRWRASLGHATQTGTTLAYISPRLCNPHPP
jgi:hypothetical protein